MSTQWPRLNLAAGPVDVLPAHAGRPIEARALSLRSLIQGAVRAHLRSAQAGLPHRIRCRHHAGRGDSRTRSRRRQSDLPGRQGAQSRVRCLRQMVRRSSSPVSAAKRSSWPFPTTTRSIPNRCAAMPERRIQASNICSMVHSETPSGTHNPVKEIGNICHEFGVLTMVDTVSGLGAELLSPEEWGLDIAIAGPQKCLGGVPGLSLMTISPAAWQAMEQRPNPLRASFLSILDWKDELDRKQSLSLYPIGFDDVRARIDPDPDARNRHGALCRSPPDDRPRLP